MNRGRYRWFFRLGILAIVGVGMLVWSISQRSQAGLAVENRSGQKINRLSVTVADFTRTFTNVPPGGALTAPLGDKGDAPCVVEGQLADGTMIRGRFGQAAGASLVILPGGQIQFRPSGKS